MFNTDKLLCTCKYCTQWHLNQIVNNIKLGGFRRVWLYRFNYLKLQCVSFAYNGICANISYSFIVSDIVSPMKGWTDNVIQNWGRLWDSPINRNCSINCFCTTIVISQRLVIDKRYLIVLFESVCKQATPILSFKRDFKIKYACPAKIGRWWTKLNFSSVKIGYKNGKSMYKLYFLLFST